ncbi:carbohydrate-binding protein [Streptomyces toyocaensis]|uniref:Carbohydrate-binding protein n=1 Tax=Streptomyces toyocaensis TaxID=55952 RepID=A0A081XVG0_STRTO|nr:carbohydrate-binding protein [Streptomyces toyocaensis]KES07533.1 carbohydrate-binding protein [Streptomyces toyocaensis]
MTPGNNGASTPEDDDPFGYLYADGQANGAQPPSGGYGYPNSVNRVRPVGTRQYGQQAPAPQAPPQQGAYGQPSAHYAAPETLPGGAPAAHSPQPPHGGGGGRGRGPNTKGLLIGAIAVVAAVVIGISVAMIGGDDDEKGGNQADASPTQTQGSTEPSPSASDGEPEEKAELPTIDAKALRLDGGAVTASDIKGAKADGGVYVAGFNKVGAKVTWTVNGMKDGTYRFYARYGIPGEDASATLVVNGKPATRPLNMKNFGGTPKGDWEKGWQTTWANVNLTKGTNTIEVVCNEGNQCNANLDQFWIQAEPNA